MFLPDQPASGRSMTPPALKWPHTLMPEQVPVIPLTLDLMPSKLRWLFSALSIETQSSLR